MDFGRRHIHEERVHATVAFTLKVNATVACTFSLTYFGTFEARPTPPSTQDHLGWSLGTARWLVLSQWATCSQ